MFFWNKLGGALSHIQNTDIILTTNGATALFNAGYLKTNLLVDDGINIQIDEIRARDGDGLKLYDDGGNGIFVKDGGYVGIGTPTPNSLLDINGDAHISGNLLVDGTKIISNSETVNFSDNHLYLNARHTVVAAQTAGLVSNYLPTATADSVSAGAFIAGVNAVSNPTVVTVGAATFGVGDLVQISDTNTGENDGIFEVLTHAANLLTIRGIGLISTVEDFTDNQFVANGSDAATLTKVNVSVLRAGTDGAWETASGSATGFVFDNFQLSGASLTEGSVFFADSLGRVAQDNANLFWDDTNNRLGIGTNNPTQKLEVVGNALFGGKTYHDGVNVELSAWGGSGSSGLPVSLNLLTEDGGGFATLKVFSLTRYSTMPSISVGRGRGTFASGASVIAGDNLGSFNLNMYHSGNWRAGASVTAYATTGVAAGNYVADLAFLTYTGGGVGNTEKMRITNIGNVGIGTSTPNAPLEVKGALPGVIGGFQSGMLHVTSNGTGEFSNSVITGHNSFNGNTQLWYLGNTSSGNNDISLINRQVGAIGFSTDDTKRMTITTDGNVGIMTANPQAELDVRGGIIAKDGFATKLWDVAGGHFETAVVNTEYYSPDQHGGIYGTIYRQYFTTSLTSTNPRLDTGSLVTKMIDFVLHTKYTGDDRGVAHGNMTAYGSSDNHAYIMLSGASGGGNLSFALTGYSITTGWVDYTK